MQGAIQKWVDHSISVTVNLPEDVDEELVAKVYQTGWESGCKGITVYRENSRAGVLVDNKGKKSGKDDDCGCDEYKPPLERPIELEADVVRFKNGEDDWISFVGIYNNRPYEIFTGQVDEDELFIPRSVKKGWIVKVKEEDGTKRYDFRYDDKKGYPHTIGGISRLFDKEYWNYAKLISGVLRNGMHIVDVVNLVDGLTFDNESISNWQSGVSRALKPYIKEGAKLKSKCPNCDSQTLVFQNGCPYCTTCGWSKCG
jgi:Ribonucleotide reductase, alpha subunit